MMTITFIPIYIHVSKQSLEIKQEVNATHFLYEEAQQFLLSGSQEDGKKIKSGEDIYTVHWKEEGKICIHYDNIFQKEIQICETIE